MSFWWSSSDSLSTAGILEGGAKQDGSPVLLTQSAHLYKGDSELTFSPALDTVVGWFKWVPTVEHDRSPITAILPPVALGR